MCISSPKAPDLRWPCYEKQYKGDCTLFTKLEPSVIFSEN